MNVIILRLFKSYRAMNSCNSYVVTYYYEVGVPNFDKGENLTQRLLSMSLSKREGAL